MFQLSALNHLKIRGAEREHTAPVTKPGIPVIAYFLFFFTCTSTWFLYSAALCWTPSVPQVKPRHEVNDGDSKKNRETQQTNPKPVRVQRVSLNRL